MRKLTVLVLSMALVMGFAAPASATHGEPVDGLWWATDNADGSFMLMRITEQGGDSEFFNVTLIDFWATEACSPDARFVGRSTTATYDDATGNLFVTFDNNRCARGSTPVPSADVQFTVLGADDQLLEVGLDNIWHHIRG